MRLIIRTDEAINWGATGKDRIIQNVKNIIRTRQFEVPFMRGLGITADFIDSTPQKVKVDITASVQEAINTYEPRATIHNAYLESIDENGNYVISVELEVSE